MCCPSSLTSPPHPPPPPLPPPPPPPPPPCSLPVATMLPLTSPISKRRGRPRLPPEELAIRQLACKKAWRDKNRVYYRIQTAALNARPEYRKRRHELNKMKCTARSTAESNESSDE